MSALVDTNVLVYRFDPRDPAKQRVARELLREVEDLMAQFEILYPTEPLLRTAIRAVATYRLSWLDAHLWAYAEHYALEEILLEDFSDGQRIGTVRIRNPFRIPA